MRFFLLVILFSFNAFSKDLRDVHVRVTKGLLHHFGIEGNYTFLKNKKRSFYIDADWEIEKNYASDYSSNFGFSGGHFFWTHFFGGIKLYKEDGFKTPFVGLEGGLDFKVYKNFSLNLKTTLTRPLKGSGVSFLDIPDFQVGIGYKIDDLLRKRKK